MKRSIHIAGLLVMGSILLSCSEKFEPKPLTYSQMLTGEVKKSWRATGIQVREGGQSVGNFILPESDCLFDDLYVFYANDERLFEVEDNTRKCSPDDPDIIVADSWALVNATATLEMVIPFLAPFKLPYILRELEEDEMTVEIWLDVEEGDSYRIYFAAVDTN